MTRIEQVLNECVERLRQGETVEQCLASYPERAEELEPLLRTVATLKEVSCVQPRPEFRAYAKARILGGLRDKATKRAHNKAAIWRRTWATAAASVVAVFAVGAGTVVASADSLPGHPLYSVKRTVERVQLAATTSDVGKAKLLATFADKRVKEIGGVVAEGRGDRVDAVTASVTRELERIPSAMGAKNVSKAAGDTKQTSAMVAQTTTTATVTSRVAAASPSQPPAATSTLGVLGAQATGGPGAGSADVENGDHDTIGKATNPSEIRKALLKEATRQKKYLEGLLKDAPDKDKPAIQRAIAAVEKAYHQAAQEGGD